MGHNTLLVMRVFEGLSMETQALWVLLSADSIANGPDDGVGYPISIADSAILELILSIRHDIRCFGIISYRRYCEVRFKKSLFT